MPKKSLILDSTQIAEFLLCPRMWHYKYSMKLTSHFSKRVNVPMQQGSLGHKYLERYYKNLGSRITPHKAMSAAINELNPEEESNGEITLQMPEIQQVKDSLWNYFFCYQAAGDFEIEKPEQVELGFSEKIYEDDDKLFVLEGKIDLLRPIFRGNQLGFADHKFQTRKHDLYRRNVQFKNYALVTKTAVAMVNYIRLTKKVDETTFDRQMLTFGPMDHEAWRGRLIGIFNRVLNKLEVANVDPLFWQTMGSEPNWAMCSGQYGYECEFTNVCEETSPHAALVVLNSNFVTKQEWKPW